MTPIKLAIRKSANRVISEVWPVIRAHLGGGEISSMELSDAPIHVKMDVIAGVDLFQITNKGITGLAARCQDDKLAYAHRPPFRTFTVRRLRSRSEEVGKDPDSDPESQCEYQKRLAAIESDGEYMYPYYTVQAYWGPDGELDRVAVVQTTKLYEAIRLGRWRPKVTPETKYGKRTGLYTHFFVVDWSDLDCFVWEREQPTDQVELW
jgi:hypothetical protein